MFRFLPLIALAVITLMPESASACGGRRASRSKSYSSVTTTATASTSTYTSGTVVAQAVAPAPAVKAVVVAPAPAAPTVTAVVVAPQAPAPVVLAPAVQAARCPASTVVNVNTSIFGRRRAAATQYGACPNGVCPGR